MVTAQTCGALRLCEIQLADRAGKTKIHLTDQLVPWKKIETVA